MASFNLHIFFPHSYFSWFQWTLNLDSDQWGQYSANVPPMAARSGGDEFLCGILANTSQAYCWSLTTTNLVPQIFQSTYYSHIADGKNHVCATRGRFCMNSWLRFELYLKTILNSVRIFITQNTTRIELYSIGVSA